MLTAQYVCDGPALMGTHFRKLDFKGEELDALKMSWEIRVRGLGEGRCYVVFHLGNSLEFLYVEGMQSLKRKHLDMHMRKHD